VSEELIAVLRRCEVALKTKTPPNEVERLELWRDVSIQLHVLERQAAPAVLDAGCVPSAARRAVNEALRRVDLQAGGGRS
jgi:hypothetical protein